MIATVAAPASIPSPSSGTLELGPLSLNAYGLMIALGVVAAIWLLGRRFEEKGIGTREDATTIGLWAVAAGIVGARLYHVATDWERFDGNYGDIVKIWEGGLGIPGGLLAGIPVGIWVAHRRGLPMGEVANSAAPAIALAQAIGRWGNWFNQELFGRPTDLPWALEIDDDHLPPRVRAGHHVPPDVPLRVVVELRLCAECCCGSTTASAPRRAGSWGCTSSATAIGRFWVESLRIDTADHVAGLRWNQWVALAAIVGGLVYLVLTRGAARPSPSRTGADAPEPEPDSPDLPASSS